MTARIICFVVAGVLAASLLGKTAVAQSPVGPRPVVSLGDTEQAVGAPQPAQRPALIPLKVDVTIARFNGDTRTSNTPFSLWVNANEGQNTQLTTGQRIPVYLGGDVTYHQIGTDITASAAQLADGRFRLNLTVQDSSLASSGPSEASPADRPVPSQLTPSMISLRASNVLILRDREVAEFLLATDKVTGEVTRISVVVTVLK